jgi:hypothetical protein
VGDKGIRISGNQVAGYQENRISGEQDRRGMREGENSRISNIE